MNTPAIFNLSQQPQHLPTLAAWHQAEWGDLNPGETLTMRIARMQAYLCPDFIPSTFVSIQNGQLAGSAALVENDMDTHPELTPWLASVFVSPPFRKQGIGSQLVQHAMQQARAAGIQTLYLFTPEHAEFYHKLGWQIIAPEIYRGHSVTLMQVDFASV